MRIANLITETGAKPKAAPRDISLGRFGFWLSASQAVARFVARSRRDGNGQIQVLQEQGRRHKRDDAEQLEEPVAL